uniref:SDR family oxidoreductase n=1 Tax=Rhizobium sp. F40D2 TaxID=3453141 RepID=UPI003F202BB7
MPASRNTLCSAASLPTISIGYSLNVRSLLPAQGGLDLMGSGGSIVLVGSIADARRNQGYGVYSANQGGRSVLRPDMGQRTRAEGIRVNVVSPGPTDTAMMAATTKRRRGVRQALTHLTSGTIGWGREA